MWTQGYIGVTVNMKERVYAHKNKNNNECIKLHNYLNKYKDKVIFKILKEFNTQEEAYEAEMIMRPHADIGLNISAGGGVGNGFIKKTDEHKSNMGNSRKGIPFTEEHKANMSKALMGRVCTKEHRENIRKALKGNIPWNKGMKMSEEYCNACREGQKGRIFTEEHREHLRKANLGRIFTDEWKANIKKSAKNRPPVSDETRENMRQGQLEYHRKKKETKAKG